MMNPLSPFIYYRRHKWNTFLLVILVSLTTLSVCVTVRLLDALIEQIAVSDRHLTRFSLVSAIGPWLEPGEVSRIRAHPDVARIIPERSLYIGTPMNTSGGFRLFGVAEADLPFLMDTCDLRLKEGRLLRPRTNEVMLSEELAGALKLRIGDQIGRSIDDTYYRYVPTELVLVGILEGVSPDSSGSAEKRAHVLTGFVSYEYLDSHELYASGRSGLIVVAQEGRKEELDRFLESTVPSQDADVWTHRRSAELLAQGRLFFHLIFSVVDCLVAIVIALVVGMIHQIALGRRVSEFGLLHAVGHAKNRLIRWLILQTAAVTAVGWLTGLALSWLLFACLGVSVLPPTIELDLTNFTPIWYAVPILLAVIAFVTVSVTRMFARLDAVGIIERGKLSMEVGDQHRPVTCSSARPLSPGMYYRRHPRRRLTLIVTMALMILGVAFPAFLFAMMVDASVFRFAHYRYISIVSPRQGASVDPGVTAQIRTHPAVARVVPAVGLGLQIMVPPLSQNPAAIYGVSEDDLPGLIDLCEMQLEEGRLPRARSNEIVVSRSVALNRGLQVGDTVGRPVYEHDRGIPTEMVIVGVLAPPSQDPWQSDLWLVGFASYEYLRSHEFYISRPVSLIVVPTEGHKGELDFWLEEHVDSEQTSVRTYETQRREHHRVTLEVLLLCAVIEGVIAIVAALALAILSHISFTQRREEFGILHAMGRGRRWLVLRTLRETGSSVVVAWLIGAAACVAGLIYMQVHVYAPIGLTLNPLNPAPWLSTLPMPLAVLAVSTGLVAWTLSRLDPVSVIERR